MVEQLINSVSPFAESKLLRTPSPYGEIIEINNSLQNKVILLKKINDDKDRLNLIEFNRLHQSKNDRFICLYEDELTHKFEIILSRIKSLLGVTTRVHGRNTTVVKLTKPEVLEFLKENHGNESFNAKYKYGLLYRNELVAVASFGQIMHKKFEAGGKRSGELIRFCNKSGVTVVGGLSKLIKHFVEQYKVDDVMTYADKNWSNGESYLKLGFNLVYEIAPQDFFVDSVTLERYNYKTKELAKNPLITIRNSGSLKFILDINYD